MEAPQPRGRLRYMAKGQYYARLQDRQEEKHRNSCCPGYGKATAARVSSQVGTWNTQRTYKCFAVWVG
jgi:hypothetical protein